jgi:hypothetical protein
MQSMLPPVGFSAERWSRLARAAGTFLACWGTIAVRLEWNTLDVFGCHPAVPAARFDCMGLVLLLERCEVAAIDRDDADLLTVTSTRQRFRRRPLPPETAPL